MSRSYNIETHIQLWNKNVHISTSISSILKQNYGSIFNQDSNKEDDNKNSTILVKLLYLLNRAIEEMQIRKGEERLHLISINILAIWFKQFNIFIIKSIINTSIFLTI